MSTAEYINLFGTYWDKNEKQTKKFTLWPDQVTMMNNSDMYKGIMAPKARQNGASECFAEKGLKTSLENENTEGVIFSKSEDFASYFLEYRILRKYRNLPKIAQIQWPEIVGRPTKTEVKFSNGSVIRSLTSSQTGAASMSLDWAIFDEAGGIDENYKNFKQLFANSYPTLDQNKNSWYAIIGTSVPGSYYNELMRLVWEGKRKNLQYYFMPWTSDPKRTIEWYHEQKEVLQDDIYLQYPSSMEEFFYVKEGLVYKGFDPKPGGVHINNFTINADWQFFLSYDHGFIHPAFCLYGFYDPYLDHLYIHDEVATEKDHQKPVDEIAMMILKKLIPYSRPPRAQFADNSIFHRTNGTSTTTAELFRKNKVLFRAAKKHDEKVAINMLATRLSHGTLTIHPQCEKLIENFKTYRWKPGQLSEKPEDKNNDGLDALCYLDAEVQKLKLNTHAPEKIEAFTKESQRGKILGKQRLAFAMTTRNPSLQDSSKWMSW